MNKLKVINLFAGPGAGKSTTRAKLFGLMKDYGMNVEEVTEFAKDVTWDKNTSALADQLFVLANQNRRQFRLQDQVEWCVTDCPLLLGIHYATPDYLPNYFHQLVFELWDTYENHNFFIRRTKPYKQVGRTQTEDEAKEIDLRILTLLKQNNVPVIELVDDGKLHEQIMRHLTTPKIVN